MQVNSEQAKYLYRQYMDSNHWRELRKLAISRANRLCEFCGRQGESVHHVRYPKAVAKDHADNLVVVCRQCHELSHGIRRSSNSHQDLGGILQCSLSALGRGYCEECKRAIVERAG